MSSTLTPNMSLIVPTVGGQPGPDYATDINNDLSTVDQHDHSPGKGVQITPAGLNINTALTLNNNFITDIAGLTLTAQGSTPALSTIYQSGNDLYFVDGVGNNVRITQSGGVAGSPGSISNLTSPASAAYVSGSQTFVWQSGASIAANMDFGAAILRNLSPNSTYSLTLQPPTLSSNYTITLPILPAVNSFMAIDNLGAVTNTIPVSAGLTTSNISASAGILGSQLSASAAIVGTQLASNANILKTQLQTTGIQTSSSSGVFSTSSTSFVDVTNLSVSLTTVGRPVIVSISGDPASPNTGAFNGITLATATRLNLVIYRDSTVIYAGELSNGTALSMSIPASIMTLDGPAAGTYTYKVQIKSTSGISNMSYCILKAVEI